VTFVKIGFFETALFQPCLDAIEGAPRGEARLVAVLFADMVEYSRYIEQDEAGNSAMAERSVQLFKALVGDYGGDVANVAGDGILALFDRPDDQHRVDYTLSRNAPEAVKVEMGEFNYARFGDTKVWNPNSAVGGAPFTTTVHVRAATSNTATNGIFQLWVNGVLLVDQHDVPATAEPFDRWSFPETCVLVPQPQSEYFWDLLVWTP